MRGHVHVHILISYIGPGYDPLSVRRMCLLLTEHVEGSRQTHIYFATIADFKLMFSFPLAVFMRQK